MQRPPSPCFIGKKAPFPFKQSAWREGISSRFNEVGRCTSRQNSGPSLDDIVDRAHALLLEAVGLKLKATLA